MNNNNAVASTSALPFVKFTFYKITFKTILHQNIKTMWGVNIGAYRNFIDESIYVQYNYVVTLF